MKKLEVMKQAGDVIEKFVLVNNKHKNFLNGGEYVHIDGHKPKDSENILAFIGFGAYYQYSIGRFFLVDIDDITKSSYTYETSMGLWGSNNLGKPAYYKENPKLKIYNFLQDGIYEKVINIHKHLKLNDLNVRATCNFVDGKVIFQINGKELDKNGWAEEMVNETHGDDGEDVKILNTTIHKSNPVLLPEWKEVE